ncbi:cytochrome P450 [Lasiosphaeria hispida]|uniref:Cytochrome P450 n=1 Tax=Lasiosphaeria hispida TaxID=260671 RepID=A0AAJ0HSG6_9PEZI|nr:cytochrome P450 [Lasiosphaeria hispida]
MLARILLTALPLLAVYLFTKLRWMRFKQYGKLPQPKTSLVWGHMKALYEVISRGKEDRHIDGVFAAMSDDLGNPPMMYIDLRPVGRPMLIVNNHEAAEQVTRATKFFPWSAPKSPTIKDLVHLIGERSLLSKQGEDWKRLRKVFNPGFAPSHLITLLPAILDKTDIFLEHLDLYAKTGEEFLLNKLLIDLTFDIIGAVLTDANFEAQHLDPSKRGELIRLYDELVNTFTNNSSSTPWWFSPRVEWKRYRLASRIDVLLKDLVRREYAGMRKLNSTKKTPSKKSRSVLSLSLQAWDNMTEDNVREAADSIKTFLFAGHDTTSILLAWLFYELSRTPRALQAVRDELDDLFGPDTDPKAVRAKMLAPGGDDLVNRMSYISAVIKETLRLHPPAGTARYPLHGTGFTMRTPAGEDVCVDGLVIYNCASIIQRDRTVYGETAEDFMPERWLGDTDTSAEADGEVVGDKDEIKDGKKIPAAAWRPFERGPRNCIGQELANIEARVIVAAVARRYDFVKLGLGEFDISEKGQPTVDEKGRYKVLEELYNTMQVTAKPVDLMRVKVQLTAKASANLA